MLLRHRETTRVPLRTHQHNDPHLPPTMYAPATISLVEILYTTPFCMFDHPDALPRTIALCKLVLLCCTRIFTSQDRVKLLCTWSSQITLGATQHFDGYFHFVLVIFIIVGTTRTIEITYSAPYATFLSLFHLHVSSLNFNNTRYNLMVFYAYKCCSLESVIWQLSKQLLHLPIFHTIPLHWLLVESQHRHLAR